MFDDDDIEFLPEDDPEGEAAPDEVPADQVKYAFIPTVEYYHKTYAVSCGGEDQRALRIFRDFEPKEKLRRLQFELQQIRDKKAHPRACEVIIGKKRKARYESYERWAQLMLLWLLSRRN